MRITNKENGRDEYSKRCYIPKENMEDVLALVSHAYLTIPDCGGEDNVFSIVYHRFQYLIEAKWAEIKPTSENTAEIMLTPIVQTYVRRLGVMVLG